jgi:hypothetical protein
MGMILASGRLSAWSARVRHPAPNGVVFRPILPGGHVARRAGGMIALQRARLAAAAASRLTSPGKARCGAGPGLRPTPARHNSRGLP